MPVGVCVLDMVQGPDDLSGENDSCLRQVGSCGGEEPQGTWRCRESRRPPAHWNLEGPLPLLWGWPGEKDTCPRDGALEVTG